MVKKRMEAKTEKRIISQNEFMNLMFETFKKKHNDNLNPFFLAEITGHVGDKIYIKRIGEAAQDTSPYPRLEGTTQSNGDIVLMVKMNPSEGGKPISLGEVLN